MKGNQTGLIIAAAFVAGLLGGSAASWFAMGASVFALTAPQLAKVVQAQRFELVDQNGRQRAVLGPTRLGDIGLLIADPSGQVRAVLTVNATGEPDLELLNEQGDSRASLAVRTGGIRHLSLAGHRRAADLASAPAGRGGKEHRTAFGLPCLSRLHGWMRG